MENQGKYTISRLVIAGETVAFLFMIFSIWLDELLDVPHLLFGAPATPINWQEALFESLTAAIVGTAIIVVTSRLFNRLKYLEGILPICANCKKIRDKKGAWRQIEAYIRERSEADFSHSICPECARKLSPEYNL